MNSPSLDLSWTIRTQPDRSTERRLPDFLRLLHYFPTATSISLPVNLSRATTPRSPETYSKDNEARIYALIRWLLATVGSIDSEIYHADVDRKDRNHQT
ncbi:hypothetical protein PAXRUDRAFT_827548 [Paxillus rubicundulus Ve08.2h10]|uniref:Uncharacterized protein n=1 Tax=Paxillus rubicundulus Ve08.2h10 TaxID=930991 RepID=A0A0D0DCF7_9AGAM|nr:hypothetical protein PAXRUDRAFT_827548 [Paxillus rubicundulus Ve08.2h10]